MGEQVGANAEVPPSQPDKTIDQSPQNPSKHTDQLQSQPEDQHPKKSKFTGNDMPPELLSKVCTYMDSQDMTPLFLCNLALVCKSFFNFFTDPVLWAGAPKTGTYILLQNTVKRNIWDSRSLNEWYNDLFKPVGIYIIPPATLPSEIWLHRKLLAIVFEHLFQKVTCAPSREDFKPYANDRVLTSLFIQHMPNSDCFGYISSELRGDETIALEAIKRFPSAVAHCPASKLNDREFVKRVVTANGQCLEFLGDYREDTELVISASRTSAHVLKLAKGAAEQDLARITSELAKPVELKAPLYGQNCSLCNTIRRHY